MKRKRVLALALVLAATLPVAAEASCIPMTRAEQRERASVIFDGVALEGPTATGIQRFHVITYVKGAGPKTVRVATGEMRQAGGGVVVTSVSLHVVRGERWRIFSRGSARRVLQTSVCDGSRRLSR